MNATDIGIAAVSILIDLTVSAVFLWIGMKITAAAVGMPGGGVYCSFADLMKVALVAALAGMVPIVGWLLALIAMYYMLRHVTGADFRELWMMIIAARLAAFFTLAWVSTIIGQHYRL